MRVYESEVNEVKEVKEVKESGPSRLRVNEQKVTPTPW